MKPNKRDATIPGKYNGNETFQKVPQAFSPRSRDASSKLLSNPSILEIKINIQKGVQNKICPIVTGTKPSLKPRLNQITIKETARIISSIKNCNKTTQ